MAELVNLRAVRKAKARDVKRAQGDENAVKFGRTKAQRMAEGAEAAKARTMLDGHRREADPPDQD
ncbi:DUF4169 family protein [Fertoebacter nigrum]|uniref:DUF4169 family protein n=1 Tax=Fertoeibacter niger TaxID=2656921 RepID=A0A8X8GUW0_9RHOB|nr:DUF4169 family protein [Fertoeibacter niger]NUB43557.1 DUF4169 family protein [Fertoeibacter niger]